MTSISSIHHSAALTLLKGMRSNQERNPASASGILDAATVAGLLPDAWDASGKITKILLESGQLIAGGADTDLVGTDGDDIMKGGLGSSISGGAGNDYIFAGGFNAVSGGEGDDRIIARGGADITGDGGDDRITAYTRHNTVRSGAGNDTIDVGSDSVVDGGEGDDWIVARANNVLTGGAGDDTILLTENRSETGSVVKYAAGDGNDRLRLAGSDATLELGEGISAGNTHIEIGDNKATITFDGSEGDSITVDLRDGSSLTVKFADGSSQKISSDPNKEYQSQIEATQLQAAQKQPDPAAVAALRAYSHD
ncbi:calcium-binding protein [Rhizobium sp. KDH_Rht_773_N]|jgi:Ca2+-binding RTX toxin-like protein